MLSKIKLHCLQIIFKTISFGADKTGGCLLFVKPKLLLGSLILSISAYSQSGTVKKNSTDNKNKQDILKKDSTNVELDEEVVFCYAIEVMPQYPGGDVALFKFLAENIQYPTSAIKNKVEGRVIVQFVVTKTGVIEKVEVVRSLSPDCDKEAIRVVKNLPKWKPGKERGKFVDIKYT